MKRKTYSVQGADGQSAKRHAWNSATAAIRDMVRTYATAADLNGPWSLESHEKDDARTHGVYVYRHPSGRGYRAVINLV